MVAFIKSRGADVSDEQLTDTTKVKASLFYDLAEATIYRAEDNHYISNNVHFNEDNVSKEEIIEAVGENDLIYYLTNGALDKDAENGGS